MVKLGLIQITPQSTNQKGISQAGKILKKLGKKNTEIVCLPEQWLKNNMIEDFESEFSGFKKIAKEFSMTIIPGAFYEISKKKTQIIAPIIGPNGEFIGRQEKIHPFDYERDSVMPGKEAKIFNTACKFGVVICSPSRIVRRGIEPWQMYVQVRALENRIPILAANVENRKYGGSSLVIDLTENNKVVTTQVMKLNGECGKSKEFDLKKYEKSRKVRFSDSNKFQ
jgi:predicted amidohydrolase